MPLNLTRALWGWALLLALVLILAVLPLSLAQRLLIAFACIVLMRLAWRRFGLPAESEAGALVWADGQTLPAWHYSAPIVLVCGDAQEALFGAVGADEPALRITEQGCYVQVSALERLPRVVDSLLILRPQWASQLNLLYVLNPGEQDDQAALARQLQGLRHQLSLTRKRGVALPLLLVSYQAVAEGEAGWFTWQGGPEVTVQNAQTKTSWALWQRSAGQVVGQARRLQCGVQVRTATAWLAERVLPSLQALDQLAPPSPPVAYGVALVSAVPQVLAGNLWSQWLLERTGLTKADRAGRFAPGQLPFPDPLLELLPRRLNIGPHREASLKALWLFVAALAIALLSSAWQNQRLLRVISDDLRQYWAIPLVQKRDLPGYAPKKQAHQVLLQDVRQLDEYYREGAPLFLGLGLYRGEHLRPLLQEAVADFREPGDVAHRPGPAVRKTVRLDSLSLFAPGSAQLKPESDKVLINALVDIKAQPGWLIVIAGHTDGTGEPSLNQQLSRARAEAVRDWMRRMGDLPESCFAVQGFGAEQPISSNDTPEGRAANRRVDIRLVPEAGACTHPSQASRGSPRSQHTLVANMTL